MKAIHVFTDVDLRCGHTGLMDMALKKRIKTTDIEPGEAILFINRSGTGMKAYLAHRIVAYMKAEPGHVFTVRSLDALVDAIEPGGKLRSNAKVKDTLAKILKIPAKPKPVPNERVAA